MTEGISELNAHDVYVKAMEEESGEGYCAKSVDNMNEVSN